MPSERSVTLHLPRYAFWILALLLTAPWLAFATWVVVTRPSAAETQHQVQSKPSSNAAATREQVRTGPWGDLIYSRILIEPPEEFILVDYTHGTVRPWVFKGYTDAQLSALWDAAQLSPGQRRFLADHARPAESGDGITVAVDSDFIIGLDQPARSRIYGVLAEFPENPSQFNPFRIRRSVADTWLEQVDLPADILALTRSLLYVRGESMCFSDDGVVLPRIPSTAERVRFIKALARKSALLMQLRIAPGQDVEEVAEYWGKGGRSKDLKPLLQSLARLPEGGMIDVVHLMPRFARRLVYTYPLPSEDAQDGRHDCHWSAFNFRNDQPDERFADIGYVRQVLLQDYYPIPGEPALGDLLLFVRPDGVVVHSCVYIADDIVFTKNGPAFSVPWLLAPLADVRAFYDSPGMEIRRYRLKSE